MGPRVGSRAAGRPWAHLAPVILPCRRVRMHACTSCRVRCIVADIPSSGQYACTHARTDSPTTAALVDRVAGVVRQLDDRGQRGSHTGCAYTGVCTSSRGMNTCVHACTHAACTHTVAPWGGLGVVRCGDRFNPGCGLVAQSGVATRPRRVVDGVCLHTRGCTGARMDAGVHACMYSGVHACIHGASVGLYAGKPCHPTGLGQAC